MASSALEQCSTPISKSLRTRRRTRTVLSSELSNRDFSSIFQITVSNHDSDRFLCAVPALPRRMVNDNGEYSCAALSLAPDRATTGLPKGAITITLPRSHSKSMRFLGQRRGVVFRLLRSPLAPGIFPGRSPYKVLSARKRRLTRSISNVRDWHVSPQDQTASGCAQRGYRTRSNGVNFTID